MLIHGGGNGEVWHCAQNGHIQHAMMRRSVFTNQSGTIEANHYGQTEQGYIMHDVVKRTLHERGVDAQKRLQSLFSQSACESSCMPFGNAHVESPVWHGIHQHIHGASRRHGRRDAYNAWIQMGQFYQRMAKHLLESWRQSLRVFMLLFSCLRIEFPSGMPSGRILLGRFEALAFLSVQMQELRPLHLLELLQDTHQVLHIVPIDRSEVAYVHTLEDVLLLRNGAFQTVAQADERLAAIIVHQAHLLQHLRSLIPYIIIALGSGEIQQIFLHASHTVVDRHVVVVQDDKQIVRMARHVVESFKRQSAAHAAIAYHSHHMAVCLPFYLSSHSHAEGSRDRVAGMSAGEGIIFTLQRGREGAYAAQLSVGGEGLSASCEYLVSIGLMPHVPHDAVVRCLEHIVQSYSQLHCSKAGSKVTRIARNFLDDIIAKLLADLGQLADFQLSQVLRHIYVIQ